MNANEVKVGTIATVKIGRNEVEVTVIEITADGWKVKSISSGREFEVKKLERIISALPVEPESSIAEPEIPAVAEDETPNPAPESAAAAEKKLSLLDAAFEALKRANAPLNCKEMIAKATADGLWVPSAAKTPEQSLYSAIFREMQNKEAPRFKRSDKKGCFEVF